jgi:hypothetical protein
VREGLLYLYCLRPSTVQQRWPGYHFTRQTTVQSGYTGVIYTGLTKIPDTPQNFTEVICMRARIYIPEFSLYRIFFCPGHTKFFDPVYPECTVFKRHYRLKPHHCSWLAKVSPTSPTDICGVVARKGNHLPARDSDKRLA